MNRATRKRQLPIQPERPPYGYIPLVTALANHKRCREDTAVISKSAIESIIVMWCKVPNCSPMRLPTAAHAHDEGVVKHDQVHGDPGRTRPKERTYRRKVSLAQIGEKRDCEVSDGQSYFRCWHMSCRAMSDGEWSKRMKSPEMQQLLVRQ